MINGNEPAMPTDCMREGYEMHGKVFSGLTIRQHFAALAMQALVSTTDATKTIDMDDIEMISVRSAIIADALIAELNKS